MPATTTRRRYLFPRRRDHQMPDRQQPDPKLVELGRAIADQRRRRRISQTDLARLVNVAQPTVSSWELGRYAPSREALLALEQALAVPAGTFAGMLGYAPDGGFEPSAPCTVERAVYEDSRLDDAAKTLLLSVYAELLDRPKRRRRS